MDAEGPATASSSGSVAERSIAPGRAGDVLLDPDHPRFPKSLLTVKPQPVLLYARGELSVLDMPMVAIVGSRAPTNYGIKVAYEAAREAARAGIVVVSGFARGLDGRAHRGALDGGGKTIAVLGCGFDVPYPRENADLMDAIPENGLLLSELPPGSRPTAWSFPARNRLIVGLAHCLLVVEGKIRGGTSNTVQWMQAIGRTVLAVPGRIDEPVAEGPNSLLQDGATPYLSPADLLAEFKLAWDGGAAGTNAGAGEPVGPAGPRRAPCERSEPSDRRRAAGADGEPARSHARRDAAASSGRARGRGMVATDREHAAFPPLDPVALAAMSEFAAAEATVFDLITPDAVHVDRIADRAGLDPGTLLAALSSLEIKGLVTQLPGKQFRLAS